MQVDLCACRDGWGWVRGWGWEWMGVLWVLVHSCDLQVHTVPCMYVCMHG